MSGICTCGDGRLGHLGRPNCVITQKTLAFPNFSPRFSSKGNRNFLPVNEAGITEFNTEYGTSFTTLKECVDWRLSASAPALDRLYPMNKVESATFERTETSYDTAASGRKVENEGVGGIRTVAMELWGKDAAFGIARELNGMGCKDMDYFYNDVVGNSWGIMDNVDDNVVRGYEMASDTFESFIEYATDTTSTKLMVSFDLDAFECEENAYAITSQEYGKKFTSIRPLINGISKVEATNSTTVVYTLSTTFGSAGNRRMIVGNAPDLTAGNANFVLTLAGVTVAATAITEGDAGVYTATYPTLSGDYVATVMAKGYALNTSSLTV